MHIIARFHHLAGNVTIPIRENMSLTKAKKGVVSGCSKSGLAHHFLARLRINSWPSPS